MAKPLIDRVAGKPLTEKSRATVERNARMSAKRRARRPLPATREEAEELFRPRAGSNERAVCYGPRLSRLAELGLLELRSTPGPKITNLEAHEAIRDFYWPLEDTAPTDA